MDPGVNSSFRQEFETCVSSIPGRYIFTAWFTVYLLFLPVFLLVLYIGFSKWKKPQSSASGGLSHSDVFTLHMVAMEMTCIVGSCAAVYGYFTLNSTAFRVGGNAVCAIVTGQVLFHGLTCVERYLAVVRPVTYLRLRGEGGVTVRNISVALVWVTSLAYSLPMSIVNTATIYGISIFCASILPLPVVAYCCICVLCALIRPKPGERGGQRKQIMKSKRSTVYTIAAILGALLLRLIVFLFTGSIIFCFLLKVDGCALFAASLWPGLPSRLVLPLLFLHRTRNK